jgi:hypothetical protein
LERKVTYENDKSHPVRSSNFSEIMFEVWGRRLFNHIRKEKSAWRVSWVDVYELHVSVICLNYNGI